MATKKSNQIIPSSSRCLFRPQPTGSLAPLLRSVDPQPSPPGSYSREIAQVRPPKTLTAPLLKRPLSALPTGTTRIHAHSRSRRKMPLPLLGRMSSMQVPMMVSLALLGTLSAVGGRASHPAHPAGGPHPRWNAGDGSALRRGGAGAAGIGSSREPLRLRGGAGVRPSSAPTRSGGLLRLRGGVSKYYNQTAPSKRGGFTP